MNSINIFFELISTPRNGLNKINRRWSNFPFIFLVFGIIAPSVYYYYNLDFDLFIEYIINKESLASPEEAKQVKEIFRSLGKYGFVSIAIVSELVATGSFVLLIAIYISATLALSADKDKLSSYILMVAWCATPLILNSIAIIGNIAVSGADNLTPETLNPLLLSNIAMVSMEGRLGLILGFIDLPSIYSLFLLSLAFSKLSSKSLLASIFIMLPVAVIALLYKFIVY